MGLPSPTDSAGKVWTSNILNYQTFEEVDDGWARISLNILAEQNGDHTLKATPTGFPAPSTPRTVRWR